jgi:hypothetical protein
MVKIVFFSMFLSYWDSLSAKLRFLYEKDNRNSAFVAVPDVFAFFVVYIDWMNFTTASRSDLLRL